MHLFGRQGGRCFHFRLQLGNPLIALGDLLGQRFLFRFERRLGRLQGFHFGRYRVHLGHLSFRCGELLAEFGNQRFQLRLGADHTFLLSRHRIDGLLQGINLTGQHDVQVERHARSAAGNSAVPLAVNLNGLRHWATGR